MIAKPCLSIFLALAIMAACGIQGQMLCAGEADSTTRKGKKAPPSKDELFAKKLKTSRISFSFDEAKIEDALAHIRDKGKIYVFCDETVDKQLCVSVEVFDLPLGAAVRNLAISLNLGYVINENSIRLTANSSYSSSMFVETELNGALQKKLDYGRITMEFEDCQLKDVLSHIRKEGKVNVICNKDVDQNGKIDLKAKDVTLSAALKGLSSVGDVKYKLLNGAVYIYQEASASAKNDGGSQANSAFTASVRFDADPLEDAVQMAHEMTDISIVCDSGVDVNRQVTALIKNATADAMIRSIAAAAGYTCEVRGKTYHIVNKASMAERNPASGKNGTSAAW